MRLLGDFNPPCTPIVATALNGTSVMRAFFTLFSGSSKHLGESDLTLREGGVLTVVMAILLGSNGSPRRGK